MSEKPGSPVAAAADNLLAKLASLPQASQEVVKSNASSPIMQTVVEGSDAAKQDAVKGLAVIATNPIMDEAKQVGFLSLVIHFFLGSHSAAPYKNLNS